MQHHFYFICRQNAVLSALFVYRFRSADFCAHLTKAPPNFLATCSPSPEPLLTGPASAPARQNPDSPPLHIPLPHSRRGQAQIGYRQQNLLSVYSQNTPSPPSGRWRWSQSVASIAPSREGNAGKRAPGVCQLSQLSHPCRRLFQTHIPGLPFSNSPLRPRRQIASARRDFAICLFI